VQHQPTGGEWPRNFAIDPSGRFLLVANQNTDNVVVFSIDPETGMLEPADRDLEIPAPVCLRFA
jgi:6-phosphogluconolactonase